MKYFIPALGLALSVSGIACAQHASAQRRLPALLAFPEEHPTPLTPEEKLAAPTQLARAAATRLPARSSYYTWDDADARWTGGLVHALVYDGSGRLAAAVGTDSVSQAPVERVTCAYDGAGNMTLYLIEVWQGSGWANSLRTVSTYNAQQNRTESIAQYWRGNAWQNDRRYAYAYNSRGMKTETVVQDWANNAWTIDSGWQTEYEFDALNRVSEQRDAAWNAAQGAFLPSQRLLFTYTGNNVSFSGYDVQGWVNGAWQNVFRNTGFVYTAQAKPAFYETHYWNGAAWQVYGRTTYSYAPNGTGYSYLNERSVANSWRNSTRYTKTYDAQGTELDDAWEIWQNNAWSYQEGSTRNTVGYDANNDLARSLQQAVASGAWKNIFKRFFSNYQTFTLSSRPATAVLPATLHPNPAAHAATLDLRHLRATGEVHITVLNALGQVVHQATARPLAGALRYELDLGALPAGVYTVRAASAAGAATQRLVRQ